MAMVAGKRERERVSLLQERMSFVFNHNCTVLIPVFRDRISLIIRLDPLSVEHWNLCSSPCSPLFLPLFSSSLPLVLLFSSPRSPPFFPSFSSVRDVKQCVYSWDFPLTWILKRGEDESRQSKKGDDEMEERGEMWISELDEAEEEWERTWGRKMCNSIKPLTKWFLWT